VDEKSFGLNAKVLCHLLCTENVSVRCHEKSKSSLLGDPGLLESSGGKSIQECVHLPLGKFIVEEDVKKICGILSNIARLSVNLAAKLA
jgi:hypothetical protein